MVNQVELKPCPFCGDTEEVETRYQDKAWRVHCGACGGCAYGWETEGQAIATWNTRAAITAYNPNERLREALELVVDHEKATGTAEEKLASAIGIAREALAPSQQGPTPWSSIVGIDPAAELAERLGSRRNFTLWTKGVDGYGY